MIRGFNGREKEKIILKINDSASSIHWKQSHMVISIKDWMTFPPRPVLNIPSVVMLLLYYVIINYKLLLTVPP